VCMTCTTLMSPPPTPQYLLRGTPFHLTTIADKIPNAYGAISATINGPSSFYLLGEWRSSPQSRVAYILQSEWIGGKFMLPSPSENLPKQF